MIIALALVSSLLLGTDSLAPPEQLRAVAYDEVLALAARQSPQVAVARAQAAVVATGENKAVTYWLPDLRVSANFDHTTAPAVFDVRTYLPPGINIPNAQPINIIGQNSYYATGVLRQPLFNPEGAFLVGPAKTFSQAAELSADESREQLLLSVAQAYFSLAGIAELFQAARDAEQVALKREADAKNQIAAGTGTQVAMLRAQSESARARRVLSQLDGQRVTYLALLSSLVGERVQPDLRAGAAPPTFPPIAEEKTEPWQQTYQVLAAKKQLDALTGDVTYDNWAWLPSLEGSVRGNYNSNNGFAGTNFYADFIVAATLPLYDHGERYARLAEDRAKVLEARAQLIATTNRAHADWVAATANVTASKSVVAEAEQQVSLTRETQRQVEGSARLGVATNLELSDADDNLFQAQSAAAQARAQLQIRRAELAASEGKLASFALSGR